MGTNKIKAWKPNLFQKLIYALGIAKDPRFNGSKLDYAAYDESSLLGDESKIWSHAVLNAIKKIESEIKEHTNGIQHK